MAEPFCTQCQAPVEPYRRGPRPEHPEWCLSCRRRTARRVKHLRYRETEAYRAAVARSRLMEWYRATQARYSQSEKGRMVRARYEQSEKGRMAQARKRQTETYRAKQARYNQSEKGRMAQTRHWQTETFRATQARYRQSEKGRVKNCQHTARRRARQRGAEILEHVDRFAILRMDDICHLCDMPVDPRRFELDHIVPLAVEAIEAAWNYAAVHSRCNRRKQARFHRVVLTPTARARWQERRPQDLAELDAHVARIIAARSDEEAAA